jgi:biotin carboxylase
MTTGWLVLVESNTTGSGRLFCAAARQLGLRPVLLARDPGRYPYVAADNVEARVADTADVAAVLAACARLDGPVTGVTSSSEYFIAVAAEAARALGLPHPDPDAVRACRDKSTQRARLAVAGVPSPAYAAVTSPGAAVAAAHRVGLPCVVKPVTGSGSVGVRLCRTPDEVAAAASAVLDPGDGEPARSLPPQDAVLVEAYADGPEYSVELLHGTPVGVTRKHLGPEPYFVETGHDFPAPLPAGDRERLERTATAALAALGLGWGASHVELRLTPAGPVLIEVNPRLAGGMIPQLISEALGTDMIAQLAAAAAGRPGPAGPGRSAAAAIRFLVASEPGRLAQVSGEVAARAVDGVVDVQVTCTPGAEIGPPRSFADRLGYVIAAAATPAAAAAAADDGLRALTVLTTGSAGGAASCSVLSRAPDRDALD